MASETPRAPARPRKRKKDLLGLLPEREKSPEATRQMPALPEDVVGEALVQMATLIASASSVADAQKLQLAILAGLVPCKSAYVAEYSSVRQQLHVAAVRGRNDARITATAPGEGVVGRAFSLRSVQRHEDVLALPVLGGETTLGCVVFLEPKVDLSDVLARALGAQAAAGWEFARLKDDGQRRNKDLQTAIAGLKSLEQNREELLSNVSHDLKNPLTTVKAYLAMLGEGKMGLLQEKQARAVMVAERNADRLLKMVNDLLLLSRLQSGKMQLSQRPFGLKALVSEVLLRVQGHADRARVTVTLNRAPEVFVKGDRDRVAEALQNLVEHAVDVSQTDGLVQVSVGAEENLAVLTVRDEGPGMTPEQLGQLFETFHRDPAVAQRGEQGLGLPIVAKVVQLHGGRVEARSRMGEGTTIRLVLPVFAAAVSLAETFRSPKAGDILLVEDDKDCREVLQEVLEQEGYRVLATQSVGEALETLAESRPAMTLLDLRLSQEDGRSVLHHIRNTPELADTVVYIISGASEVASLATGTGLDRIDGYFEKPLQLARLLSTVASVVRPVRTAPREA